MSRTVKVGLRVVRGVDWEWGDQDGGEGCVGTIVEVGGEGSKLPNQTVVVLWDSGVKANYRAGYQGKDDLRVFENAPAGVRHDSIVCEGCRMPVICGLRWKCTECNDFDLCNECYMTGKHDTSRAFYRFDTPTSTCARVAKRDQSRRLQSKGIFIGAQVVRGPDWSYGDQDGGSGKKGEVKSIGNSTDGKSWRSWAKVKWDSAGANDYRVGHDGLVDLKYVKFANGFMYYADHLPTLVSYCANVFQEGESAYFNMDVLTDAHKQQLSKNGVLNMTGRIGQIDTDMQKVTIRFPGDHSFSVPASLLLKGQRQCLSVGDIVKIKDDAQLVQKLQDGHGGWNNQMTSALGKQGKVVSLDSDGDAKVEIGNQRWIFNPECCILVSSSGVRQQPQQQTQNQENSDDDDSDDDTNNAILGFAQVMAMLMGGMVQVQPGQGAPGLGANSLVREAAQGHTDNVRSIVGRFPQQVDIKQEDRTALQVASHQGHQQVVAVLLNAGAKPEIQDGDGDTSYHYAAFGNEPGVLELLLKKTTTAMNSKNKNGRTALQVAVCKQHVECVRVLLKYNCDVNTRDADGDTPLHDAIDRPLVIIVELLLASNRVDFKLQNNEGFNVLHRAAFRGNNSAVTKIVQKAPQFVNVVKSNGFTALHLAVLNGHTEVVATLIDVGKANMEMTTENYQTALLVAINRGLTPIVELLVTKKANLEAEDSDGDTALHLVLLHLRKLRQQQQVVGGMGVLGMLLNVASDVKPKDMEKAPEIYKIFRGFNGGQESHRAWLAIACFLAQAGAKLDHKNRAGKSPIDDVADTDLRNMLQTYAAAAPKPKPPLTLPKPPVATPRPTTASSSSSSSGVGGGKLCMMCTSEPIGVTFRPCGHSVACIHCSSRMKQCFSCHDRIQEKVLIETVPTARSVPMCVLCTEQRCDVTFQPCGHCVTCYDCSRRMKNCTSCKQPIQEKVRKSTVGGY